jgi:hypothetical protein
MYLLNQKWLLIGLGMLLVHCDSVSTIDGEGYTKPSCEQKIVSGNWRLVQWEGLRKSCHDDNFDNTVSLSMPGSLRFLETENVISGTHQNDDGSDRNDGFTVESASTFGCNEITFTLFETDGPDFNVRMVFDGEVVDALAITGTFIGAETGLDSSQCDYTGTFKLEKI